MLNKKILILSLSTVIAMSPLTVIAACATSNEQAIDEKKEPTTLRASQFQAQSLGLNQPILSSLSAINSEWIIKNKMKIFKGTTDLLTKTDQILDLKQAIQEKTIKVTFSLSSNSYVDANGQVPSQSSDTFGFVITDFVDLPVNPDPDQPEIQPINLQPIVEQATFDVANKAQVLPSDVRIEQLIWNQANQNPNVGFIVSALVPDNDKGKLGFNLTFFQKNLVANQEEIFITSDDPKAISGFKSAPVIPSDQNEVEQEAQRLLTNIDQVILTTQLSTIEIIQYQNQPNSFKDQLNNLNEANFIYNVVKFDVDQANNLTINLLIKKNSAIKLVQLVKKISVLQIDVANPEWVKQAELNRLNAMINNSFLLKTTFSKDEVQKLNENNNEILSYLFNFVSTYGFHYRVSELKFNKTNQPFNQQSNEKTTLTFKIEAMLWKSPTNPKPVIESNQFHFDVEIINEQDDNIKPPLATVEGWKITGGTHTKPFEEGGMVFENSYILEMDLKQNNDLDFAVLDFNDDIQLEQLSKAIFKAKLDWFVNVDGKLPDDWDWDKYLSGYNFEAINDGVNQTTNGLIYTLQVDYIDSKLLDLPVTDNSLSIDVKLTNGYNSGQAPAKPTPEQTWNDLKTKFESLIATQAIDDEKLHHGTAGIYSFAQIAADKPTNSDYFANFLNFSPTAFQIENQHLFKATAHDATINYLTNTIKFKWVVEGLNNKSLGIDLSQFRDEYPNQIITYQPQGHWAEQINFDDQNLAITNQNASLNNILDRFGLNNQFIPEQLLKDRFQRFGTNWTWKAREFANYVRFTFYQAFNDGADAINMAILGIDPNTTNLTANPQNYTIVLKAKLNQKAQGNYLPYLQMFGASAAIQARQWNANDTIEIRLDVQKVPDLPSVITNANEIFPGLGPGNVLGTGRGANEAYLNSPPRNDLFSIGLGTTSLTINHNNKPYLTNQPANHRFLALNMLSRYDFKDPILPEPPVQNGWIK